MRRSPVIGLSVAVLSLFAVSAMAQDIDPKLRPSSLRINIQNDTPALGDFTVGPTRFLLPMKPGEERTVEVQVTNRKGEPSIFSLSAEDFAADPDREGAPMFLDPQIEGPFTARLWIEPEYDKVQLLHGERAFIRITIRVPEDAEAGDHQAALIVTREMAGQPVSGFGLRSRVAALFIITVEGDVVQEGSFQSLWATKFINWWLPVQLNLSARNSGTVHMIPSGTIEIRNIFGIVVDELPIENWIVLRDSGRVKVSDWSPKFALGRYTATTNLTLFGGRVTKAVGTAFWVIPLLPVLLILLAIFLVSFLIQYFSSRFEITRKGKSDEKKPEKK